MALLLASDGGHSWPAAIVFGVAGVTDQVDGCLARRWRVESSFGKIADPLADRLMIDAAVILLWHADRLPWIALAIPARDVALIAGYKFVVGTRLRLLRQPRRQGGDLAALRRARLRHGDPRGHGLAALDLLGRRRARGDRRLAGYLLKARREVETA